MRVHALLLFALLFGPRGAAQELQWSEQPFYPRLEGHAAALDTWRNRLVVFGGRNQAWQPNDQTWEWDGRRWMRREPTRRPESRMGHAMAFDPGRGRTILFGAAPSNIPATPDVWEWDGHAWELRRLASGPNGRAACELVWNPPEHSVLAAVWSAGSVDTWSYGSTGWRHRGTRSAPSGASAFALGFDSRWDRQQPVLRIGTETWIWNGHGWQQVPDTGGPPGTGQLRIAFDSAEQALIAVHSPGDFERRVTAWRWSGAAWEPRFTAFAPLLQRAFVFASDPTGALLLDGGNWVYGDAGIWRWGPDVWERVGGPDGPQLFFEWPSSPAQLAATNLRRGSVMLLELSVGLRPKQLWEWRRGAWEFLDSRWLLNTSIGACMVRDERRDRLVEVGSEGFSSVLWEWDGLAWSLRVPDLGFPRAESLGAYMLHEGKGLFVSQQQTWSWDGTRAQLYQNQQRPIALAVAHDPVRRQTILISQGQSGVETWEWVADEWRLLSPKHRPGLRGYPVAMCFDGARGRIVLLEGQTNGFWSWDGADWATESIRPPHKSFLSPSLAWEPGTGRLLVRGGRSENGQIPAQTLLLTPTAAAWQAQGSACGGVVPPVSDLCGTTRLGTTAAIELTSTRAFAPSAFLLGAAGADLPLGPCRLHVDPAQPLFVVPALTDVHGLARLPLPIPYDLALRGLVVHTQALVEDPLVPFTRIATSAGLALRIGD